MDPIAQRLSLRHLRLVAAIQAEGNLLRAAQHLNMTQSAVTKALQDAEAIAGVPLFERTNRGVTATMFGRSLTAHARLILAQMDNAAQELTGLRDGSLGSVAVGTLLAASASLLPESIAALRRSHPKLVLRVVDGTNDVLMPALRSGELDMVIGRLPEFRDREALRQETLLTDYAQIVLRKGHPLTRLAKPSLADLLAYDWVLPGPQTTLRRQIDAAFRAENLEPPSHAVDSVSFLTTRALLLSTDFLAVWPVQLAALESQRHDIASLDLALPTTRRPIGITTRAQDRTSPAAALLIDSLRTTAARHATTLT